MILIPPPPPDSYKELAQVIQQYNNPVNPEYMQYDLDKNISNLFSDFLRRNGLHPYSRRLKMMSKSLVPTIMLHKRHFNRPRPQEYANRLRLNIDFDNLKSAQSASYPSGHSAQAYFLAYLLSQKYPQFKKDFYNIAQCISLSRVDRGVHYPSDLDGGQELGMKIARKYPVRL